jgi:hypothetical protein
LAARLAVLAQDGRWSRLLAPAAQEVRSLADLAVRALYGPHPPDAADREQALHTWRRLDRRLWLARLRQWLRRW